MKAAVENYSFLTDEVQQFIASLSAENLELIARRKKLQAELQRQEIEVALVFRQPVTVAETHQSRLASMIEEQKSYEDIAYRQWDHAILTVRRLAIQNARLRAQLKQHSSLLG